MGRAVQWTVRFYIPFARLCRGNGKHSQRFGIFPPWPVLCLLSCRNKKVSRRRHDSFQYRYCLSIRTPPPALRPVPLPCEQGRFTGVGRGYGLPRQCAHWLAMTNREAVASGSSVPLRRGSKSRFARQTLFDTLKQPLTLQQRERLLYLLCIRPAKAHAAGDLQGIGPVAG